MSVRNEIQITLAGEERTMRATFGAIRGMEIALNCNLLPLLDKMMKADIGVGQAAIIIQQGLKGYGDTRLTLDQIGEAIMEVGLSNVMPAAMQLVAIAMQGPDVEGKSPEAPAA